MTAVRALDKDGDWTFGRGRANYLTKIESTAQRLATRIRCVRDNWFLDFSYGIDYANGTPQEVEAQIRRTILETKDVAELVAFSADYGEDRNLVVTATVRDITGELLEVVV